MLLWNFFRSFKITIHILNFYVNLSHFCYLLAEDIRRGFWAPSKACDEKMEVSTNDTSGLDIEILDEKEAIDSTRLKPQIDDAGLIFVEEIESTPQDQLASTEAISIAQPARARSSTRSGKVYGQ